jgi:hypothetical protein
MMDICAGGCCRRRRPHKVVDLSTATSKPSVGRVGEWRMSSSATPRRHSSICSEAATRITLTLVATSSHIDGPSGSLGGRDTFEFTDIKFNTSIDASQFGEPNPIAGRRNTESKEVELV